jgi:membrane protein
VKQTIWQRHLVAGLRRLEARLAGGGTAPARLALRGFRLVLHVMRQWARDRCPQQAASLAFQTVLSMVPLLAVALAALRATGNFEVGSWLVRFVSVELLPVSPQQVSHKLLEWSENVTFKSMGLVGLVSIALLAFVMVSSLERVVCIIWRAERHRSLAQKFIGFYAGTTLAPLLVGTSLYQAARVGLTSGVSGYLFSFAASFTAAFFVNYFLPATQVRVGPAALGALVSTVLFEVAKYAFQLFVVHYAFDRYAGIYGAMAAVPLLLLWIYYSWLTLLLGVELAHVVQNLHLFHRWDRRGTVSLENELLRRVNGAVAARLMVAVAEAFASGRKALPRPVLMDRFELTDEALERLLLRLKEHDLVVEVDGDVTGLMPARPLGEMTLADVLRAFRGDDLAQASGSLARLDHILGELEELVQQRTRTVTLAELVGEARA